MGVVIECLRSRGASRRPAELKVPRLRVQVSSFGLIVASFIASDENQKAQNTHKRTRKAPRRIRARGTSRCLQSPAET